MKRPTFALLSLLALLALGLTAARPHRAEAGSLGELAFAIAIEETDAGDPIVCPRVCCPLVDEYEGGDEPNCDEAAMELNAAETQIVEDNADNFDYDAYYGDYGFEYGDEYDPYSEDATASDDVASDVDALASNDMELNAADTCDEQLHADGCFDEYYGEYADRYTNDGCDYCPTGDDVVVQTQDACNDVAHVPVEIPCHYNVRSQISESDLVLDESPEYVDPFDAYGQQVGDDYASEYYDDDYGYYEEDFYYEHEDQSDESAEVEAISDAITEIEDAHHEEFYDDYYSEDYDNYDADQYEEDYERYYSEEYYDQLEESAPTADSSEEVDDYTSDYDAIYDDAVYGDAHAAAGCRYDVATPPMVPQEHSDLEDAYLAGQCIDEASREIIDDLPWADELEIASATTNADVRELDVPVMPAPEPTCGETSEYGSDYAEEYYEEYYDSLEAELFPLEAAESMPESADCHEHSPVAAAMHTLGGIDIVAIVSHLGRSVSEMADSLSTLGSVVRTACDDIGPLTRTR